MPGMDTAFDILLQTKLAAPAAVAVPAIVVGAHPLPNGTVPYLYHGEMETTDDYSEGRQIIATVHVFSKKAGPDEVKTIQEVCRAELHAQTFVQSGFVFSCIREDYCSTQIDPDKETWHGIQRFRALVQISI